MKKFLLAVGIGLGFLNFAQATNVTLNSGTSIDGVNVYEYLINVGVGTQIANATLTFNNVTLTTSGGTGDDISYDLINRHDATQTINDGDVAGDYFKTHTPYSASTVGLGVENFTAPHNVFVNGHLQTVYDTESWTYTFSGAALAALQTDGLTGSFDIGLDPDCIYTIGSIVFSYTTTSTRNSQVPETTETAMLMTIGFLALILARRKTKLAA